MDNHSLEKRKDSNVCYDCKVLTIMSIHRKKFPASSLPVS